MLGRLCLLISAMVLLSPDSADAQGDFVRTDELVVVEHEGTFDRFVEVRDSLLENDNHEPFSAGRILLRKYPIRLWDKVSSPQEPEVLEAPAECYLCDFVCDYVDLRIRQDWVTLEIPPTRIDFTHEYSLKQIPHLQTFECAGQKSFRHISKTLDRSIVWDGKRFARLGLVSEISNRWPGLIDLRLVGWVSQSQLSLPTAYEQWRQVMKAWQPYAIERVDEDTFDLIFLQKQKSQSHVWSISVSVRGHPVIDRVQSVRMVKEFDSNVVALPKPVLQSEIYYEEGRVSSVVSGDKSGIVWRWDFTYTENPEVSESIFSDQWLSELGVNTIMSPALKAATEALSIGDQTTDQ